MGPLGVPEIIFILVLVLLVFGPKRLPEFGRMMGKGLGEFRRASNELKRSIQTELALEELEETPRRRRPTPLAAPASAPAAAADEAAPAEPPAQTVAQHRTLPWPEPPPEARVVVDPHEGPPPADEPAPAPAASPIVPQ